MLGRIERFWRDLFRMTSFYYDVFKSLEEKEVLDIDNRKQVQVLQMIFIPRIQRHLDQFRKGWNCHPILTEGNKTPNQLMLLHLPPPEADLPITEVALIPFYVVITVKFSLPDFHDCFIRQAMQTCISHARSSATWTCLTMKTLLPTQLLTLDSSRPMNFVSSN